ncbi:integral membrane sensor signal transduction histidine kinase [Arcobacter nitrofigilis DSM 7299]|uniref:histidine kinase n=1 Tax=Arcobacter nitrofigilis (strain ATCC 33309 / DSM 7299 / CCUG 15893 / LMG 7604 / NCTC 12251 / CI) TaxID=572480 RepID=D5V0E0_ARCNC|nr:HAMP domain-containing sensor histidine kinase [Arcobacter nitrofigilis]ADG93752.1 integral membrane sensor signal transduction histidine kinase [Arcobacter nitrofigilis DSM 7299]
MIGINTKSYIFKLALSYSFLIIILICIPAYFYTQSELESYKFNQNKLLDIHTSSIQRSISDFSDSKSNIFNFPKSFSFDSYLFKNNNQLIYSTTNKSFDINKTQQLIKKVSLSPNRLNADYLVVTKAFDYEEIYIKITLLTLILSIFVFISLFLILKQSITPYKKANDYLDAFFNDAMHELKTPLGVIQLNLEMLQEKQKDSKEISRCLNGLKNLLFIYEDIEYLIKNKRITFTKEDLDLSLFLKQRVELFESLAKSKNIIFDLNIEDDLFLFINRAQIQRVIDNTISNAIKYSKENQKIIIKLKKEEQIILSIQDFGKGIKNTSTIFNRYYREDTVKGGFGIGLNIVKNICQENNIKIKVISKLNKGSSFSYFFQLLIFVLS